MSPRRHPTDPRSGTPTKGRRQVVVNVSLQHCHPGHVRSRVSSRNWPCSANSTQRRHEAIQPHSWKGGEGGTQETSLHVYNKIRAPHSTRRPIFAARPRRRRLHATLRSTECTVYSDKYLRLHRRHPVQYFETSHLEPCSDPGRATCSTAQATRACWRPATTRQEYAAIAGAQDGSTPVALQRRG